MIMSLPRSSRQARNQRKRETGVATSQRRLARLEPSFNVRLNEHERVTALAGKWVIPRIQDYEADGRLVARGT
jgi:hypothetical protein